MPVSQISPREAQQRLQSGAVLVDVREAHERAQGMIENALGIAHAELEDQPQHWFPDHQQALVLICQAGVRSSRAAEALQRRGYAQVYSVRGGMNQWRAAGLPVSAPAADFDHDFHERYARHLSLPQVGLHGQQRLEAASVLILGAGGLGSPAAFYLAAAGVGRLRLIDHDRVERSNLQRQILHCEADIGKPKVQSAEASLTAINPRIRIESVPERLQAFNVDNLLAGIDVVIDGADNFTARYLLNDACVRQQTPLVYGAVHRFEGQVSVFDAGRQRGRQPCYRCLFPEAPPAALAPNCAEAGVLGVLPGVIGMLQATEALKLLLDIGESLSGRLLHFDALGMRFRETRLLPDPDCAVCAPTARRIPALRSSA